MAELSGLEVFALAKEIEFGLRGTYVKNVYSLGRSQVVRFGRPADDDVWAVASPSLGVWLSKKVAERAETTPFTTRLRQELVRKRFSSCRQLNGDRIFDLEFGAGELAKHLVVELMPPGNIVVTGPEGRVLAVEDEVRTPSRRVARGGTYSPPPQRRKSPASATEDDVSGAIAREKTAGGVVGRGFSLPRKYVAAVLSVLGVPEGSESEVLKGRETEVASVLRSLVAAAASAPHPCVCEAAGRPEIFVVAPPAARPIKEAPSVSELCDEYLLGAAAAEVSREETPEEGKARELEATVSKLKAQREGLLAEAKRLRELAARARGATSLADAAAMEAAAGLKGRHQLTSKESVSSAIFDRAKEAEAKADDALRAADSLSRKRVSLRRPGARPARGLRRDRQEWYEKFRWFTTSAGKLAVGGRDAQSNSILVKRHLDGDDTVYHADLYGSPFFVLKGGKGQTDDERAEMAQATVAFSSAWKTGLGAADAYWVTPDQVSTSAPSGEFLARGSFLIRGKKNFVPHNLVEIAVGIEPEGRVLSGPEAALKKVASAYVVLRPQNEKSSETAKRVRKDLEALSGAGPAAQVSLDDVLRMLPAGGGKVLRRYSLAGKPPNPRNA